jgi:hypothetical protein
MRFGVLTCKFDESLTLIIYAYFTQYTIAVLRRVEWGLSSGEATYVDLVVDRTVVEPSNGGKVDDTTETLMADESLRRSMAALMVRRADATMYGWADTMDGIVYH